MVDRPVGLDCERALAGATQLRQRARPHDREPHDSRSVLPPDHSQRGHRRHARLQCASHSGQQFIKGNPDPSGVGVSNGIVEYSVIEYTSTAKDYYTNGLDMHGGANWIIRHNLFRNIVGPPGQLAGPAILMWRHSGNTVTEGNTFINCAR